MTDWFLPRGAPGSPDEWCFDVMPTSEIRVHTDCFDYFARLADLMAQTKENDEIFLIGWLFDLGVKLKNNNPALLFLEAARFRGPQGRGARVRLLATPSPEGSFNEKAVADAKKLEALIDPNVRGYSRNHQKSVFIKLPSTSHIFVGGMDIAAGRLDAFFDVQAEVIGLGAALGRKSMEEQWESLKPPLGGVSATTRRLGPSGKGENHFVQFVRTYQPFPKDLTGWTRTYAKDGDHTYYALICRALSKVKHTLYLEEQCLWATGPVPTRNHPAGGSKPPLRSDFPDVPDTLEHLLLAAIGRGVKVVVVGPNYDDEPTPRGLRDTVVKSLTSTTNPPVLLKVRKDMMIVHSKTWIFDDEFVVIGSANFWHNSFLSVGGPSEGELGVGFTSKVDGTQLGFPKVSFARALRIRLWERLRGDFEPTYAFPRNAAATFDDELKELQSKIGGVSPFLPM